MSKINSLPCFNPKTTEQEKLSEHHTPPLLANMEPVLLTPRLKLTLITHAPRGSDELKWLHELRSNTQSTLWSIHPPSKTLEDTERIVSNYLPLNTIPNSSQEDTTTQPPHRIAYAVHRLLPDTSPQFIGQITLAALTPHNLPLPPSLVIPKADEQTTLVVELAYAFLPAGWGKGFATESLTAVLAAVRAPSAAARGFWAPWEKVWMRVIVNGRNAASQRVMRKLASEGVEERGVYEWRGEPIFIGGEWMTEDDLRIFGGWVRQG